LFQYYWLLISAFLLSILTVHVHCFYSCLSPTTLNPQTTPLISVTEALSPARSSLRELSDSLVGRIFHSFAGFAELLMIGAHKEDFAAAGYVKNIYKFVFLTYLYIYTN
jgi:hypothetical protein